VFVHSSTRTQPAKDIAVALASASPPSTTAWWPGETARVNGSSAAVGETVHVSVGVGAGVGAAVVGAAVVGDAVVGAAVTHVNLREASHVSPDAGSRHNLYLLASLAVWYHAEHPPSTVVGRLVHDFFGLRSCASLRPSRLLQSSCGVGHGVGASDGASVGP
jgi:hypothetical protein